MIALRYLSSSSVLRRTLQQRFQFELRVVRPFRREMLKRLATVAILGCGRLDS